MQAAEDVLTWRLVAAQVTDEDERSDVQRKLGEAETKLKEKVRQCLPAVRLLLTRKGEQLDVVFAKFDDDKAAPPTGNDVWGALVRGRTRPSVEHFDPTEKRRKRTPAVGEVRRPPVEGL